MIESNRAWAQAAATLHRTGVREGTARRGPGPCLCQGLGGSVKAPRGPETRGDAACSDPPGPYAPDPYRPPAPPPGPPRAPTGPPAAALAPSPAPSPSPSPTAATTPDGDAGGGEPRRAPSASIAAARSG